MGKTAQQSVPASSAAPSREANPFATCWTRPGALAYRFAEGESAKQLVARLAAQGWWGEIVGPHGSGKSTLLASLMPELRAAGRSVASISLRDGQRRLPHGFMRNALGSGWLGSSLWRAPSTHKDWGLADARPPATPLLKVLVIVDGYEQLGWLARQWLKQRCRRAGAGLVVTSHVPTGLPKLAELAPDAALVQQLVSQLANRCPTSITEGDVAASRARHGSNVREILFELYDLHERRRAGG